MNHILRNKSIIPLDIPKGYYVVCNMNTQTSYRVRVCLIDENGRDLVSPMERQSTEALPPLFTSFTMHNEKCNIVIDIPQSTDIDSRIKQVDFNVLDDLKVRTYIIIAEDGGDGDYNDLFLTITAYQNKG